MYISMFGAKTITWTNADLLLIGPILVNFNHNTFNVYKTAAILPRFHCVLAPYTVLYYMVLNIYTTGCCAKVNHQKCGHKNMTNKFDTTNHD